MSLACSRGYGKQETWLRSPAFLSIIWNEILEIKTYIKRCQLSDFSFLLHFTDQGWCWPVVVVLDHSVALHHLPKLLPCQAMTPVCDEYSAKQNLGKPWGEQWLFSCYPCNLRDLPSTRANCIVQATLHACWCYFISKGCLAASVSVDLDLTNITGIRFFLLGAVNECKVWRSAYLACTRGTLLQIRNDFTKSSGAEQP